MRDGIECSAMGAKEGAAFWGRPCKRHEWRLRSLSPLCAPQATNSSTEPASQNAPKRLERDSQVRYFGLQAVAN
jgi:hypothetical protein